MSDRMLKFVKIDQQSPIKRDVDRRKEDFNVQKVREGISLALRKRPVKDGQINQAVENIKLKVNDRLDREVSSHEIGEMVMTELKELDEVAYVRFASVYREFKDASEFIETIQSMQSLDENDSSQ